MIHDMMSGDISSGMKQDFMKLELIETSIILLNIKPGVGRLL